jgi:hypothetical protein
MACRSYPMQSLLRAQMTRVDILQDILLTRH